MNLQDYTSLQLESRLYEFDTEFLVCPRFSVSRCLIFVMLGVLP